MIETLIADFHTSFYFPEIQNLVFYFPGVHILGTHHCGNAHREAFKRCREIQDVLCRSDYAKRFVASFTKQIQSEYYGRN